MFSRLSAITIVIFIAVSALLGLSRLTSASPMLDDAHMGVPRSLRPTASVEIVVGPSGLTPSGVTITVGSEVIWRNTTTRTLQLQSGAPYRVFLPIVLRGNGALGNQLPVKLDLMVEQTVGTGESFSGTLSPGASFTHTFNTIGLHPFFIASLPQYAGSIVVQPLPTDFTLGVIPGSRAVQQGQSISYTVSLTGTAGFTESVLLSVGGLPTGVSAAFDPNPVVPTTTVTVNISSTLVAALGDHVLTITGTSSAVVHSVPVTLTILPHSDFALGITPINQAGQQGESITYTISITALHGFDQPVALNVTGLPGGATGTWSATSVTPTAASLLTITLSGATPTGSYTPTITGVGGGFVHTTTALLMVTPHAGFTLAIEPALASSPQGVSAFYTATVAGLYDFVDPVTLTVSGLPAGVSAAIAPNPVTPTSTARITLTTSLASPLGDHVLTVTGTGSGRSHSVPFTLTLTPHPDFTVALTPTARAVMPGQIATYTAQLAGQYNWTGPVSLSLNGMPAGTNVIWSSNPVTPDGSSVMSLSVPAATTAGVYPITLVANGGLITHTGGLTLTVVETPRPDLAIESIATQPITLATNVTFTLAVRVRNQGTPITQTFGVDWYLDPAAAPTTSTVGTGSWLVNGLDTGATLDLTATYLFTGTGTHTFWAIADRDNQVIESAENNNRLGPLTKTVISNVVNVCGGISTNTTWFSGFTYLANCDVTVSSGVTLTIEPSVTIKFGSGSRVNVYGALNANGTAVAPVVFTSQAATPAAGYWVGIHFWPGSHGLLNYTTVEYAGYNGSSVVIESSDVVIQNSIIRNNLGNAVDVMAGTPTIQDSSMTNNSGYPLMVANGNFVPTFTRNTLSGNGYAELSIGAVITRTVTWPAEYPVEAGISVQPGGVLTLAPNLQLKVQGGVYVLAGGTLNAGAGTRLSFGRYSQANIYGTLNVNGTVVSPVVFTSQAVSPAAGDWYGFHFYPGSHGLLNYATVEYAGASSMYSSSQPVVIESSDVVIQNSIIRNNLGSGISVCNNAQPAIHHNEIYGNSGYGVENCSYTGTIDARYNWWGDDSGPAPFGSGNGVNGRWVCNQTCYYVYDLVRVDPWVGKQTQQAQPLVTESLPPDPTRDTAAMEPETPYILSIDSEHDSFLFGEETTDRLTVNIDWNGLNEGNGTPGIVTFKYNGNVVSQEGTATGAVYDLPVASLAQGVNPIEITSTSSDGKESWSYTMQLIRFTVPKWLLDLNFGKDIKFKVTRKADYLEGKLNVKFPVQPFSATAQLPDFIPFIGGQTGIPSTQAGFELSLRTDGQGTVSASGTTGFKIKDNKVTGKISGKGDLQLSAYDLILKTATFGVELGGKLHLEEPIVSVIPLLAGAAHTPVLGDILNKLRAEADIEPSVNVKANFKSKDGGLALEWLGVEGGGALKITLSVVLEAIKDSLEASVYGGGDAAIQLQALADTPISLKKLSGGFFVGAKLKVWFFEASGEKAWDYSYEPQTSGGSGGGWRPITASLLSVLSAEPVMSKQTGWQVEQPTYGSTPYAQFVGNRARSHGPASPTSITGLSETPLVTNLYADAKPALALRGSDAVLAWVHDDTNLPDSQSKEILAASWDGANWSTPINVTSNTLSEFNPKVAFVNDTQALAVWERINDPALPITTTFGVTTTQKLELAYSTYNLTSHTWSVPALLTNNAILDHNPQLSVGNDGSAMTVWTRNSAGEIIGLPTAPDTLQYAIWNGTNWNPSGTIASNISGTLRTSLAYRNATSATLVLSLDTDGYFTTTADIELFYTTWNGVNWSTLTRLTNNVVADESPIVLYTSTGERRLIWLRDGQIYLLGNDWSALPTATQIQSGSSTLRDFRAAVDNHDNLMLIWQGMSSAGADLYYAIYDTASASWRLESQLTNSQSMEKQIAPAFDPAGQLMVAYALDYLTETVRIISPTLTITGVTTYDHTDLYVLHYTPNTDLAVTQLALPEYFNNPTPGDTVNVQVAVQNLGDWPVVSPTLALYDGNPLAGGTLITTTYVVSGPLAGGASQSLSLRWTVPITPVQSHALFAMADPAGDITETNETNNLTSTLTTLPDLVVSSAKTYYYDQHRVVPLAVIANNGPLTATNVLVEFRADSVTGTLRYSQTIPQLGPNGLSVITTTWDVSGWPNGDYTYYAVVNSNHAVTEANETDNSLLFPVKVLPDLVIYAGDVNVALSPATGGPVTVTVRNWGTANAANVIVTLYEGPVITTGATSLYTWTVPTLAVDGAITLTTVIDHQPNRLFAIADPANVITEVEEINNVALWSQPISITFRYQDLENAISPTATITLVGDWITTPLTLTGTANVYSITVNTSNTPLKYRYAVNGDLDWLNTYTRTVTPTVASVYTDQRSLVVTLGQLDGPVTISTSVGTPTPEISAQVLVSGVTPLINSGASLRAEVGYGTSPTLTGWLWFPITSTTDLGSNDRFTGIITPTMAGVYSYTIRVDSNWGVGNTNSRWLYLDFDGLGNGFDVTKVGGLSVQP